LYQNEKSNVLSGRGSHTSAWRTLYHTHKSDKSSGHLAAILEACPPLLHHVDEVWDQNL
jgi:hypothetical protein